MAADDPTQRSFSLLVKNKMLQPSKKTTAAICAIPAMQKDCPISNPPIVARTRLRRVITRFHSPRYRPERLA